VIARRFAPVGLAALGFVVVVVGIYQGLLHVAPGYEGTIVTGWGGDVSHEEVLFARLAAFGLGGTVAALRWRRLAVVPVATGCVVAWYAIRAVAHYARDPGLYADVPTHGGDSVRFVLGAEPVLLVAGGGLLVGAGVLRWRGPPSGSDDEDGASAVPAST
jgi:hypothetical protein